MTPQVDNDPAGTALRQGELVVAVDEFRQVGVAAVSASAITPAITNFFTTQCRGILYAALPASRLDELAIPPQPRSRTGPANLRMPVDLRVETTTGISSHDRTATIAALVDAARSGEDFLQPGHVTPVELAPAGVLDRPGLPEALQDLAWDAGCPDGVAFCAVLDEQGGMATVSSLRRFAAVHGLPVVTISDVVRIRRRRHGWPASVPTVDVIDLPFIEVRAAVRSVGANRLLDGIPLAVHELCVMGSLTGGCDCSNRLAKDADVLRVADVAAVVVYWRGRALEPFAQHGASAPFVDGLADLVAARLTGGHPQPIESARPLGTGSKMNHDT